MDNPELTNASTPTDNEIETHIGALLIQKGWKISVAESCTGGRIASRLTRVAGSSRYFESACITYSNNSKERLLSVSHALLEKKGAVSAEIARAMAEGIRKKEAVDLALSVTGIAGPGGGSQEKPVGLVYIALSDLKQTTVTEHHFQGNREQIQAKATQTALEIIKQALST